MGKDFEPLPGSFVFNALKDKSLIILAVNPRINIGILDGIFAAAKEMNSVVIFELARSESDLKGGYSGLTPKLFARNVKQAAEQANHPWYVLHADHLTVRKPISEEVPDVKELISAQIEAGFSSFAIDGSFLFNLEGKTELEQLQQNIDVTTEIALFIKEKMKGRAFGLEVEVGEIGKKDASGFVVTSVAEATTFIKALNKNDIFPHYLAIANGSTHGNIYDENGDPIEQISINIPQTIAIGEAIKPLNVRLAQHGITGTPLELIEKHFPRGLILKGNVGTHWMNIVWDVLKISEPDLYEKIWNWTIKTFKPKNPGKPDRLIFGEKSKYAVINHFDEIYQISGDTIEKLKIKARNEAIKFITAFNTKNSVDALKNAQ